MLPCLRNILFGWVGPPVAVVEIDHHRHAQPLSTQSHCQDIYRAADEQLCFRGKIELVCLVNGRLGRSEDYDQAFRNYLNSK